MGKTRDRSRRAAAAFNFITNPKFKGPFIRNLSDEQLLSHRNSTIRSIASAATGTAVSGTLSVPAPVIFLGGAVVNAEQLTVSLVNFSRVRREIKRRTQLDPNCALLEQEHKKRLLVRDIAIGATVKLSAIVLIAGLVGGDELVHNITELFGHAQTVAVPEASTAALAAAIKDPTTLGDELVVHFLNPEVVGNTIHFDPSTINPSHNLNIDFPNLSPASEAVTTVLSPVGNTILENVSTYTGIPITPGTSWIDLQNIVVTQGWEWNAVVTQLVSAGLVIELTQVVPLVAEVTIDDEMKQHDEGEMEKRETRQRSRS